MISPGPHRTPGKRTRNRFGKNPPRCVVWGDRIDLLSAYQLQSLTTAAGASSQNSYPIAQILTVNQPRGISDGGGTASHMRVWGADSPHKMYQIHQSYPPQLAKSQKKGMARKLNTDTVSSISSQYGTRPDNIVDLPYSSFRNSQSPRSVSHQQDHPL